MKMTLDKKLGKLKMPSKRPEMDLSDLSSDDSSEQDEGSPEEEASESPDEEAAEDSGKDGDGSDALKAVSDDELMAEIKKRGLLSKLEKGGDSGDDSSDGDQSMYA